MKNLLLKLHLPAFLRTRLGLPARGSFPAVTFANIGDGTYETGRKAYIPDASTTARYLMYKQGSDADHCALAGSGDLPLGPSDDQADTTNLVPITINLLGACPGTLRVVTDGSLSNGDPVKCVANGQVGKATSSGTDITFGRALITTDMSSAAGDVITIIPDVPFKNSF